MHNTAAGQSVRIADLTGAHEQLTELLAVDGVPLFRAMSGSNDLAPSAIRTRTSHASL